MPRKDAWSERRTYERAVRPFDLVLSRDDGISPVAVDGELEAVVRSRVSVEEEDVNAVDDRREKEVGSGVEKGGRAEVVVGEHDAMVATDELEGGRVLGDLEIADSSVNPERELLSVERGRVRVPDEVEAWRTNKGRVKVGARNDFERGEEYSPVLVSGLRR